MNKKRVFLDYNVLEEWNEEQITEAWDELANKISLNDVMMIALFEDILPDSAFIDAFENIREMLADKNHDISIKSINKLLETYSEYWSRMFLGIPHLMQ